MTLIASWLHCRGDCNAKFYCTWEFVICRCRTAVSYDDMASGDWSDCASASHCWYSATWWSYLV